MKKDLIGQKFGRLTVVAESPSRVTGVGYRTTMWECRCDCGNTVVVRAKCLLGGVTKSCGCLQREQLSNRASKHHGFNTKLYNIWDSMRQRCNNPHHKSYHNYGGRGIVICDEWGDFSNFLRWALSAGYNDNVPRGECTLDRIDVNKPYSPDNCRWVSMKTQSNNKRNTIYITLNRETRTLAEWAELSGVKYQTAYKRYRKGLSPAEIFKK